MGMKKKIKPKKLNTKEAEVKRVAVLLTELEQAASQVLVQEFHLVGEQANGMVANIRTAFQKLTPPTPAPLQRQRLGQVAQTYGLAATNTLLQAGYNSQQANAFLTQLVEQGKRNRSGA